MKTPWHIWVVGIVSLLWNAGGAYDYTMTKMKSEIYLAAFTPEQLAYFTGFPTWITAAWAIAIWFSVLGSILLLARSGQAVIVFTIAFLAMLANFAYGYFLSDVTVTDVTGPGIIWFSLAIVIVGFLLVLYSRTMRQRGILG